MARNRSAFAFAMLVSCGACSVDDVDYSGKLCSVAEPCPGDYSCTNGACCLPGFRAEEFSVAWKTPNGLRFSWTPVGEKDDFVQYVLVLGKTSAELATAEATALRGEDDGPAGSIRTASDNPELGQYELRQSAGVDEVAATTADQLEPGIEYRARLLAFDTAGCAHTTSTAVARTEPLSAFSFTLFDDLPHPAGVPRPSGAGTIQTSAALSFEGDAHLFWPGWPDDGSVADGAYENVGVAELSATLASHYPALDFSTAYIEAAIALDGPALAAWGEARVLFGPTAGSCDPIEAFTVSPSVLRSGGEYSVIQIPLARFQSQSEMLDFDALSARSLCEVSFGRSFALSESVRVDAIRLRW